MKDITRIFDLLELYRDEYKNIDGALWYKASNVWNAYSSEDYIDYSTKISLGLLSMGVSRTTKIGTILVNSPEWNFFDMGIMMAGAIQVPIYPTISEDNYKYILNDASVEYIIVSTQETYQRIHNIIKDVPSLKEVFSIDEIQGIRNWKEIIELGKNFEHPEQLESIKSSILPDDMVTNIYIGNHGQAQRSDAVAS
jgi:long-chain acyl-CoA synthetase